MIKCPNKCSGGLEKQKILWWTRKKDCHVCRGRGFIVDTAKFFSMMSETFLSKSCDMRITPKGNNKFLVEIFRL